MKNLLRWLTRVISIASLIVTTFALLLAVYLLSVQSSWDQPVSLDPRSAFIKGSIGTEIMPLPVFVALPKMFPEYFQPLGPGAGNYARQFGMHERIVGEYGMPGGFFLSNKRPKSGAPSPVRFVGISCVMCHATEITKPTGDTAIIVGSGNMHLNLFAWVDAFQNAILDERLDVDEVCRIFEEDTGEEVSFQQRLMIDLWLRGLREALSDAVTRYGDPFAGKDVFNAEFVPTGPGRTQPFRTLVRRLLDRPGADMAVYTKVASVFHEDRRKWAQVDGSLRDLHARSSIAAFAAGATIQNMARPDVAENIRKASDYTRDLGASSFFEVFPEQRETIDDALVASGRAVYRQHCHECHGSPKEAGGWEVGPRMGEVVHYAEVGTDKERVAFRRFRELPDLIHASFPKNHPFYFDRAAIRPGPEGETPGYINAPIEYVYARAPYLHNASILTLAELINLRPRRSSFYRGRNIYDPENVGLSSPDGPTDDISFRFDTGQRGNSNRGHDFPWAYDDPARDEEDLKSLLAYLKTF